MKLLRPLFGSSNFSLILISTIMFTFPFYYRNCQWHAKKQNNNSKSKQNFEKFSRIFLLVHLTACRILVPWPGIEPKPWQWKLQGLTIRQPGNSPNFFHIKKKISVSSAYEERVRMRFYWCWKQILVIFSDIWWLLHGDWRTASLMCNWVDLHLHILLFTLIFWIITPLNFIVILMLNFLFAVWLT